MDELRTFVKDPGGIVVELGSRDGLDAEKMAGIFTASRVVTIEANPESFGNIVLRFPQFENYNVAISNVIGEADFWQVNAKFGDVIVGQSSLMYKESYDTIAEKIRVPVMTMDKFVEVAGIDEIEVMKIDVEGATYEALEGFTKIRMTRLLHIESEHEQFWTGQHLYEDTEKFMTDAGYERVYYQPVWTNQSDTIWLRKD